MPRTPARRAPAPETEPVEIRLIARDGITQHLAAQIAAAIPACTTPRFYPSRKTPGQTIAYLRATLPTPPAINP
ncbi:hypothetical protein MHW47_11490 [Streptomyces sp. OfavH-34-F]|uniref:hypothetical protein n=1 Tax=Streptomyces sp. OfavH-34-F TaxID=2917760 RepID=UPI001EF276C3|nr:hypothetical protein [Streptomyces sp. OfavH-34-F]MCG7525058.1 hypothetical protein [Streptomyces sp. OfavH-34-F]